MTTPRYLDVALDSCVDALLFRGESLEACLRIYPEYEADLRPVLEVVESLRAVSQISVSSAIKVRVWVSLNVRAGYNLE